MQVELEENVVHQLKKLESQAFARAMPFDAYLAQFVENGPPANSPDALEEFDKVLEELATVPTNGSSLPAGFSRADIYADHD